MDAQLALRELELDLFEVKDLVDTVAVLCEEISE